MEITILGSIAGDPTWLGSAASDGGHYVKVYSCSDL